jgi:hypothetical protein
VLRGLQLTSNSSTKLCGALHRSRYVWRTTGGLCKELGLSREVCTRRGVRRPAMAATRLPAVGPSMCCGARGRPGEGRTPALSAGSPRWSS